MMEENIPLLSVPAMKILGIIQKDCASKLRVHYWLPRPLLLDDFKAFPEEEKELLEFSRVSPGAQDLIRVGKSGGIFMTAILGQKELVVTFFKSGSQSKNDALLQAFEASFFQEEDECHYVRQISGA